jgi:galactokinase
MDVTAIFTQRFGSQPSVQGRAPGRVNILGEHVDYNDGMVLPAALDRAVHLAARPLDGSTVTLYARDLDKQVAFSLDDLDRKVDVDGKALLGWALYPAGVAWALRGAGLEVRPIQAAFTSDVPIGAGLSSSAAVQVGFATIWQAAAGWQLDKMTLARLCQKAENDYVGVASGLMDQFASACGVAGHALLFDTRSLKWQPEPLPEGTAIVIADSRTPRTLAGSAYNDRRAACEKAVELLRQYKPSITSLRDISPQEFAAYSVYLPEVVRKRAEHIVKEIARVEAGVSALRRGDKKAFGALMYASHASLRDLYEVSIPELDALVQVARGLSGIIGARLTGAGFGGCTVNLVEEEKAPEFIQGLSEGYQRKTGREAQVYLCQASAGAEAERI